MSDLGQVRLSAGAASHTVAAVSPTKVDLPLCPPSFVPGVHKRAWGERAKCGKRIPLFVSKGCVKFLESSAKPERAGGPM